MCVCISRDVHSKELGLCHTLHLKITIQVDCSHVRQTHEDTRIVHVYGLTKLNPIDSNISNDIKKH